MVKKTKAGRISAAPRPSSSSDSTRTCSNVNRQMDAPQVAYSMYVHPQCTQLPRRRPTRLSGSQKVQGKREPYRTNSTRPLRKPSWKGKIDSALKSMIMGSGRLGVGN